MSFKCKFVIYNNILTLWSQELFVCFSNCASITVPVVPARWLRRKDAPDAAAWG